jgi:hypothetical protein
MKEQNKCEKKKFCERSFFVLTFNTEAECVSQCGGNIKSS